MTFDMRQCKPGDRLITRGGVEVVYGKFCVSGISYSHFCYLDGSRYRSYDDNGVWFAALGSGDYNIVGFHPDHKHKV